MRHGIFEGMNPVAVPREDSSLESRGAIAGLGCLEELAKRAALLPVRASRHMDWDQGGRIRISAPVP